LYNIVKKTLYMMLVLNIPLKKLGTQIKQVLTASD